MHSLEGDVSRTVDLAFSTTGKVYAFRDMVLNCAGIAYYLESHASVVDRRLKGLSREDAEAVLRLGLSAQNNTYLQVHRRECL